jgi:tetratricopeptide (TPR) repeat protein
LILTAKQRLAEFEDNQKPSNDSQGDSIRDIPLVVQTVENLPSDYIYQPGDMIGQVYEVKGILGRGGFGVVYLVHDRRGSEVYALKTFKDEYLADAQVRERFRKEALILVKLGHYPYLVNVYSVDEFSGRLFMAMEYIAPNEQGINTLAGYLKRQPPTLVQSLYWAIQICHGMEYAYSKGVRAHRDLKPENIMISQEGKALVTDFGLAGILGNWQTGIGNLNAGHSSNEALSGKTQIGIGFGTPYYMPPEQFENAVGCDERSDIYSLGIILFQMGSDGNLPFTALQPRDNSDSEIIRFNLTMEQLHKQALVPQLDSPLFPIIQKCLEKKPDQRYQRFQQLRYDLETMLRQQVGGEAFLQKVNEEEYVATANEEEPPSYDDLNEKGVSLVNLGHHEEAIHCFDQALEAVGNAVSIEIHLLHFASVSEGLVNTWAQIWNNKAASLKSLGRTEEALSCYEKALQINPIYGHAWNGKGGCLMSLHRLKEAQQCFAQALNYSSEDEMAWSNQGKCLWEQGRYEDAIRFFDQALNLIPLDKFALMGKGDCLVSLTRFSEALQCYDEAINIDPQDVHAWSGKSVSLRNLGRLDEAWQCCDKALEIDPKYANAWFYKAHILYQLRNFESAIHCCDKALEIDLKHANAWYWKGCSLNALNHNEEALHCYDKALDLNPNNVETWIDKGFSLECLGHPNEAIPCYDKALEIDPKNSRAWTNKGSSLQYLGRYEEASRCCDKSLEIDPKNDYAWYIKASSEDHLGRNREAILSYQQYVILASPKQASDIQQVRKRIRELGSH